MILTPLEVELLTSKTTRGQKRYDSQAKVLDAMGIPYTRRPDKTLAVLRKHVDGKASEERLDSPALVLP